VETVAGTPAPPVEGTTVGLITTGPYGFGIGVGVGVGVGVARDIYYSYYSHAI
jgi:hypothetical protein